MSFGNGSGKDKMEEGNHICIYNHELQANVASDMNLWICCVMSYVIVRVVPVMIKGGSRQ